MDNRDLALTSWLDAVIILEGLADQVTNAAAWWILTAAAAHLQNVNHRYDETSSFVAIWWHAQDVKEARAAA